MAEFWGGESLDLDAAAVVVVVVVAGGRSLGAVE